MHEGDITPDNINEVMSHLGIDYPMTPYDKLIARKRKWTPVAVEGGPVADGTEDAFSRCLALRCPGDSCW